MVNIDLHRNVFVNILRTIYSDSLLRTTLGFKGGTAAMLFYNLPRFSVDLDFDLLDPEKKELIFERLKEILPKFGVLDQAIEKQSTFFFIINYQSGERNLKVEISKRSLRGEYELKNFLGISMLVMKKDDMVAGKLAALITRKKFASRDLFDLWFFLTNNWLIDDEVVKEKTGLSIKKALEQALVKVLAVQKTELLTGLGDLLDNRQKAFVKEKLQNELIFQIKLYLDNLKRK